MAHPVRTSLRRRLTAVPRLFPHRANRRQALGSCDRIRAPLSAVLMMRAAGVCATAAVRDAHSSSATHSATSCSRSTQRAPALKWKCRPTSRLSAQQAVTACASPSRQTGSSPQPPVAY